MLEEKTQVQIEETGNQLREKISSKFQTSIFLAGFNFAILGTQISILWQSEKIPQFLWLSISLMFVAILLYIWAVINLDKLTMPKLFWHNCWRKVKNQIDMNDPETQRCLVRDSKLDYKGLQRLYQNMVSSWMYLTFPAIGITALSLLLLLLPVPPLNLANASNHELFNCLILKTFSSTLVWVILTRVYLYCIRDKFKSDGGPD